MLHSSEERILNGLIDAAAAKQQMLTNNLANIMTKGYVRKDMDFGTVMRDLKNQAEGHHKINIDSTIKKATYEDGINKPTYEQELSSMYENYTKYVLLTKMNGHIYQHAKEATEAGKAV